ncbi:MAG: L-rhamnose mutarotase [Rectinemataceae bacterium]
MRWYCLVNELKPECVEEYRRAHLTMHESPWKKQLEILKKAGAEECISFLNGTQTILFYRCEEINESFAALGKIEGREAWDTYTLPMFASSPRFDGSASVTGVEKIFDLRQQLDGYLEV